MSTIIPQPKSVMSHSHLQSLFAARYPDGSLVLSKNHGGGKRQYSVSFEPEGTVYGYGGSAKDVADKLNLTPTWTIGYYAGRNFQPCVTHWNREELEGIIVVINGEEWRNEKRQTAQKWGADYTPVEYTLVC